MWLATAVLKVIPVSLHSQQLKEKKKRLQAGHLSPQLGRPHAWISWDGPHLWILYIMEWLLINLEPFFIYFHLSQYSPLSVATDEMSKEGLPVCRLKVVEGNRWTKFIQKVAGHTRLANPETTSAARIRKSWTYLSRGPYGCYIHGLCIFHFLS